MPLLNSESPYDENTSFPVCMTLSAVATSGSSNALLMLDFCFRGKDGTLSSNAFND